MFCLLDYRTNLFLCTVSGKPTKLNAVAYFKVSRNYDFILQSALIGRLVVASAGNLLIAR